MHVRMGVMVRVLRDKLTAYYRDTAQDDSLRPMEHTLHKYRLRSDTNVRDDKTSA